MKRLLKTMTVMVATGLAGACAQQSELATQANLTQKVLTTPAVIQPQGISSPLLCEGVTKYRPLPAFPAGNYQKVRTDNGKIVVSHEDWPTTNALRNQLLTNISSSISVENLDASIDVGPFIDAEGAKRRVTIDFMKYRSEPVQDNAGKVYFYSRIGAGLRLTMNIATTDANLGSGSLLAIALSAKAGRTRGEITADVIGMDSNDITLAMPFTSDVSEGSIQSIIEALAVIKAKLHDQNTTLEPQFIARIDCVKTT